MDSTRPAVRVPRISDAGRLVGFPGSGTFPLNPR